MPDEGDRSLPKTPPAGGEYYVFRDAVHNLIEIEDEIEGRYLRAILGTRELQRLRRLKQNGVSALVYQSLEGSRFPHALGAYHIARKIIRHLQSSIPRLDGFPETFKITDRTAVAFPLAALVHDIGHGPLSHIWEELFGSDHEAAGLELIKDSSTRLNKLLVTPSSVDSSFAKFDGIIDDVESFLANKHHLRFLFPLISGHVDVDRLDFMARDTRAAGVTYGFHDLEWIIRSLHFARIPTRVLSDGSIGTSQWVVAIDGRKGLNTLVQFLRARENMYNLVYHHKTNRAAQCLLKKLFTRVKSLLELGQAPSFPSPHLNAWFNGDLTYKVITNIEDDDVYCAIKLWAESDDAILSQLSRKLLERDLYKVVEIPSEVASVLRTIDEVSHGAHLKNAVKRGLDATTASILPVQEEYWYDFDKTHFDLIGDPLKDDINPIWIIQFGRFGLEYTPLRKFWIQQFGEHNLTTERHYVHCISVAVAEAVQSYVDRLPEFSANVGDTTPVEVSTFKPIRLISKSGANKEVYLGINLQPGTAPRSLVAMKYYKDTASVERDLQAPNMRLENANRRHITLSSGYQHPSDIRQYVLVETCWHASIEALVKQDGLRRQLQEILDMGRQLFRGLSVLHGKGIRHTDIKLDNCGYNYDGPEKVYKIGDFGCMSVNPNEIPTPTLMGTKRTISPERLADPAAIGLASDVWALGVTIYAACAGRYWFLPIFAPHAGEGRSPEVQRRLDGLEASVKADVPAAVGEFRKRVRAELPPLLAGIIELCFVDFARRPAAATIADAFEESYRLFTGSDENEQVKRASLWCQFEDLSALPDKSKIRELRESVKGYQDYVPPALWNA